MTLGFRHLSVMTDDHQRFSRPAFHVITSEVDLQAVYGGVVFRPAVSPGQDLLVCVHRGLCPTGGYTVVIEELRLVRRDLVIRVCTRDPKSDEFVTLVATYPADVVAVSRQQLGKPGAFRAVFKVNGTNVAAVPFVI